MNYIQAQRLVDHLSSLIEQSSIQQEHNERVCYAYSYGYLRGVLVDVLSGPDTQQRMMDNLNALERLTGNCVE